PQPVDQRRRDRLSPTRADHGSLEFHIPGAAAAQSLLGLPGAKLWRHVCRRRRVRFARTTDDLLAWQLMSFPRIAGLVAGATLLVAGLACPSSSNRDQFYGTDVGANWIPPDATVREAGSLRDAGVGDGGDVGVDGGADGAPSADVPAGDTL